MATEENITNRSLADTALQGTSKATVKIAFISSFNILQNLVFFCITWGGYPVHRVAAEDPERGRTYLSDSVMDIWENMKQFFKPFPCIREPRETVGKAAQLGRAR